MLLESAFNQSRMNWATKINKQHENDYKTYWRETTIRPGSLHTIGKWIDRCFSVSRKPVLEMFCKQDLDCRTHLIFMAKFFLRPLSHPERFNMPHLLRRLLWVASIVRQISTIILLSPCSKVRRKIWMTKNFDKAFWSP